MNNNVKGKQDEVLKLLCIKTNKGCFISDCMVTSGCDYDYHNTKITKLVFDGKKATTTYCKNWYFIEAYPTIIQEEKRGASINKRYELRDASLESEKMPKVIPYEDKEKYSYDVVDNLYSFTCDKAPDYLEDIICDIQVICEVDNYYFPPSIEYDAIHKVSFTDSRYTISNANVYHQMLDKIMFPAVLLHESPCKFTSKQMYDITRQYIIDHIDNSVAKITSNYDFCFTVKKLIPLIEPETITYQNIFGRTKRERSKIHAKVKKFEEKEIFEMTHAQEHYKGYSIIPEMTANNETELKEKVDAWLEDLMAIINKPLCQCPHCNGTGYLDDIKKEGFSYRENNV